MNAETSTTGKRKGILWWIKNSIILVLLLLFWVWHFAFAYLTLAAQQFIQTVHIVATDFFPADMLTKIYTIGIVFIFSVLISASIFITKPRKVIQWFVSIEFPLLFVLIVALAAIRILHSGTIYLIGLMILTVAAFFFTAFTRSHTKNTIINTIRLILNTISLATGLYISVLLFATAIEIEFHYTSIQHFLQTHLPSTQQVAAYWFLIINILLLFVSAVSAAFFYANDFIFSIKMSILRLGYIISIAIPILLLPAIVFLFFTFNHQVDNKILKLNAQNVDSNNETKHTFTDIYIAQWKYVNINFWFSNTIFEASVIRHQFLKKIAQPFLYKGDTLWLDTKRSQQCYENIFDEPIAENTNVAQHSALMKRNTIRYMASDNDFSSPNIYLQNVSANILHSVDSNKVSITFELKNNSISPLEAKAYFYFPFSAQVEGVWCSTRAKNLHTQKGELILWNDTIKKYDNKVVDNLNIVWEQCGDRQFRFRVFPLLPNDELYFENTPNTFVTISYKTSRSVQNAIPLFLKGGNTYSDAQTTYFLNNRLVDSAQLFEQKNLIDKTLTLSKLSDIIVGIDQSYSMKKYSKQIENTIQLFKSQTTTIDVVDFRFHNSEPPSYHLNKLIHSLKNSKKQYEAILFLTDEDTYFSDGENYPISPSAIPIYVIYISPQIPAYTESSLLRAVYNSGGGFIFSPQMLQFN